MNRAISRYVTDTHALYWYLTASTRLGDHAKQAFDEGSMGRALIFIPVIVLAELYFLNEKYGHPLNFSSEYHRLNKSGQFIFVPFLAEDILSFDQDTAISEMHDRMIVGVARRLGAVCISMDSQIDASKLVKTIW